MNVPYPELEQRLAALRAYTQDCMPPERIDVAIAAAVRRRSGRAAKMRRVAMHWIAWPLALAASVGIMAIVVRALSQPSPLETAAPAPPPEPTFTLVVPMAEFRQTADAVVVPARVPRMTLAQYGLPLDPVHADEPVNAELLVRRDGSILAYRFAE